ncbi:MAG TPA: DUF366 family protein [Candidatus Krumholzibacteria bacterium]|nr:DUF366 family protein [Candidatus Krumholzibacteria bacterium]
MSFQFRILEDEIAYTGAELRSGWVAARTGLEGEAAAGFVGPCRVPTENLADLDDARAGTFIEAASMAHVIAEHACELPVAVLRQRILVALLGELLRARGKRMRRDGDDLYYDDRKLTVSIAAPAAATCVIHLGINVDPAGAPVPAVGLTEMRLDEREILLDLLTRYQRELDGMAYAATKVRTVS